LTKYWDCETITGTGASIWRWREARPVAPGRPSSRIPNMAHQLKIGFIGVGRMGAALLESVLRAELTPSDRVFVHDADMKRRDEVCANTGARAASAVEIARSCDVVLVCVKPGVVPAVLDEIKGKLGGAGLVISIAAGVTLGAIEQALGGGVPVVRAMPNIAATVGQAATALAGGSAAGERHLELAEKIFSAAGKAVVLPEALIDAVTGLAGSGPAYVFLFAEALVSAGLKVGLPADAARELAVQTIKGAAIMLEQNPQTHPATLRDSVTTPGGTTIAGLHELERGRLRDAVIRAVEAATERSREIGKK